MNLRLASLVAACSLSVGCGGSQTSSYVVYAGQAGSNGFDIWEARADGALPTDLTPTAGDDLDVDWNQPTKRFAFASDRSGNFDIYSMNADGSNVIQLTTNTAMDRFPSWKPDGDHILYASDQLGNFEIMRMEDGGSHQTRLTNNNCLDTEPAWSPDGARIVFVSSCAGGNDLEIFVMDANGTNIVQLTSRPGNDDFNPTWSPDGSRIAFESVPIGGSAHVNTQIMHMNADGSNVHPISTTALVGDLIHPAWSPGGDSLLVAKIDSTGDYNIYTVNLTGGTAQMLLDQPATQWSPAWGEQSR